MTFTAHDVRKLRLCNICQKIGHADEMPVWSGHPGHYHGECLARMLRPHEVLALPESEQRKFRLSDVGADLMRRMLDSRHHAG